MNRPCFARKSGKVKRISRFVSETANMVPLNSRPFVGKSAFAHKGGIHVSAIMKNPRAYEHMDPELVGNIAGFWCPTCPAKAMWNTRPRNWGSTWGATGTTAGRSFEDQGPGAAGLSVRCGRRIV